MMKARALTAPDSNRDIFRSSPHLLLYNTDNKEKTETLALTLSFLFFTSWQIGLVHPKYPAFL